MVDDRALIAHLLRRTSFGPLPGQVDAMAPLGIAGAIDTVLGAGPQPPGHPPSFNEQANDPPRRWLGLMAERGAGLHEKLVWFWHGQLTASEDKVSSWKMMYRQHLVLRHHALGNFRDLLQAMTVDPAMLVYLDGDGSVAAAPNENFGREVMELFALGRGNYTQADVGAAAVACSGWSVDAARGRASFDASAGPAAPVRLLGRDVGSASAAIDAICDQPACALWITDRLYRFLVGEVAPPPMAAALAQVFRRRGLEIRPVVEAIVRDPAFLDRRGARPRSGVEWVVATAGVFGSTRATQAMFDACGQLSQTPYQPPNVSGWPTGPRWLSPSFAAARSVLAIAAIAGLPPKVAAQIGQAHDPVAAALDRCSLYEVSDDTRAALRAGWEDLVRADDAKPAERAATLLALTVSCPEFALA